MLMMETGVLLVMWGEQNLHLNLNGASVRGSEKQYKPHAEMVQPSTQHGSQAPAAAYTSSQETQPES